MICMSPVGALNNGIELLADEHDPDMREKCLELLADSARASANKLKFFRLAFGAAGGFGEEIDTREAQAALEGVFGAERRIELGWMVERRETAQGRGQAAAQPGDDRRRRAGSRRPARCRRRAAGRSRSNWSSAREGPRILLDPVLRETLAMSGGDGTVEPRAAGAWLAHSLVAERWRHRSSCRRPDSEVLMIGARFPRQEPRAQG